MARSRMMGDDPPETPSPRKTIVGGRPPEKGDGALPIPTGIQSLLRLASVDGQFRDELVERRASIAGAAGVTLTASEAAILGSIPDSQLREMAVKMPPPNPDRRAVLRQTAATAVVLLGGAAMAEAVSACCGSELTPSRPEHNMMQTEGGAAPDEPEHGELPEPETPDQELDRLDHNEMMTTGGAAPDIPEEPEIPPPPPPEEPTPEPPPLTRGHSHDVPEPRSGGKTGD
ncbi:MAG: hypothetical protein QGH45_21690 [Myxococcota bacterium]|nr:hypothetical protein [Myxococcota bacterium]